MLSVSLICLYTHHSFYAYFMTKHILKDLRMFYSQIVLYMPMKHNTYDLPNYLLLIQVFRSSKMSHVTKSRCAKYPRLQRPNPSRFQIACKVLPSGSPSDSK